MENVLILILPFVFWGIIALIQKGHRTQRIARAVSQPFALEWIDILKKNLPQYANLPDDLRDEFHNDIKVFLGTKSFEGCGGLDVTDEIKVTIAAQACMLLLNRKERCYPKLRSILVYPSTYIANDNGKRSARLGESWTSGVVVLSWSSVKQGAFNFKDGHNVAMHEFAHQLDQEDGVGDGAPILERRSGYSSWARIFSKEFGRLQKKAKKGRKAVFDPYGATNPAEFFAVATECFFEKPRQMKGKHPELFDELKGYYKVDPGEWL